MVTRHTRGKVVWVDLESPSHDELQAVMQEFKIDGRIAQEISTETPYPLIVADTRYLYLILHFPTSEPRGGAKNQEIDIIVGKRFLITARYEVIDSIHNLHKVFEAEELLGLPGTTTTSDALLERILRRMYNALREEVEDIGVRLERVERDIFGGKEKQTVRTISEMHRVLLRFNTTLALHAESLSSFLGELTLPTFFGESFFERSRHIEAEREHVATLVSSYRAVAMELRDTNDSLLTSSQNEVMKTLTVVTFIILPASLITELFMMNIPGVPLQGVPNAFWIVIAMILITSTGLILYSKRKGWF